MSYSFCAQLQYMVKHDISSFLLLPLPLPFPKVESPSIVYRLVLVLVTERKHKGPSEVTAMFWFLTRVLIIQIYSFCENISGYSILFCMYLFFKKLIKENEYHDTQAYYTVSHPNFPNGKSYVKIRLHNHFLSLFFKDCQYHIVISRTHLSYLLEVFYIFGKLYTLYFSTWGCPWFQMNT